ncbi:MAG: hypothetical protein ACLPXZ_31845, partial [Mycobacterium sp.]
MISVVGGQLISHVRYRRDDTETAYPNPPGATPMAPSPRASSPPRETVPPSGAGDVGVTPGRT